MIEFLNFKAIKRIIKRAMVTMLFNNLLKMKFM